MLDVIGERLSRPGDRQHLALSGARRDRRGWRAKFAAVLVLRVLIGLAGAAIVIGTVGSAFRTVIVPRGVPAQLARVVFVALRVFLEATLKRADYERRDRALAFYGPAALLILLATWIVLTYLGFALIFFAFTGSTFDDALVLSGSSLFTLGFSVPRGFPATLLVFTESALGLIELALLITYLPTLYAAFQRRELLVTSLEIRAGSPPSGVEMLGRYHRLNRLGRMPDDVWGKWEDWFSDIEETHTSLPALPFFRSPQPDRSWITAAGAVLDAASLLRACVDIPVQTEADLCIRAGYIALRRIAEFFGMQPDLDPSPDGPIAIIREEFDQAWERLREDGVPLKPDPDQAWRDFRGWRVNYDGVLIAIANAVSAPVAPWSSDRGATGWRPPRIAQMLRSGRQSVSSPRG